MINIFCANFFIYFTNFFRFKIPNAKIPVALPMVLAMKS